MTKEEIKEGGTFGEGETSKKENDQPIEVGNETEQTTDSGASNASADPKAYAEQFMQTLNGQVNEIVIEKNDRMICELVNNWANKPTKEAENFLKMDYSKYRYIGRKLAQAGVSYRRGLGFLKNKYPDEDLKHLEDEFRRGFGEIDYDPDFRNKLTKNLKP